MADMTYQEALEFVAQVYDAPVSNIEDVLRLYNADVRSADDVLAWFNETKSMSGAEIKHIKSHTGTSLGTRAVASSTLETNITDSNIALKRATEIPIASKVEVVAGNAKATFKTGVRETGKYIFNDVIPAVCAAGLGVTLGKTLDAALYNAFPNFFDSLGLWSVNPDTWNSLCTDDSDALDQLLLPVLFGIDGRDTQAYMDEDAAAYLAWWLAQNGYFDPEATSYGTDPSVNDTLNASEFANSVGTVATLVNRIGWNGTFASTVAEESFLQYANYQGFLWPRNGSMGVSVCESLSIPSTVTITRLSSGAYTFTPSITVTGSIANTCVFTVNDAGALVRGSGAKVTTINKTVAVPAINNTTAIISRLNISSALPGVGDQTGAILPDTTGWNTPNDVKQSLQNQYPDMWNNAKHYDYVDENGNNKSKTYVPFNMPNAKNKKDPQPVSGNEKQTKPQTDPDSDTELKDLITQLITLIPTINPDPTGSGDTPPTVIPVGGASSLWKIYNPTQAQVDAFGSWLWDSSFVEQIKKLFNDPMQAIIGIHKVFATPSIGGTATIKVGYLDSQVSSAWVDNQYTTVNCGSASLNEYFENVFDYSPYTKVQLYLPFIGIVDLDIADVMRSKISVVYHVDVLTGACLADVKVNRDGVGGVLYQFAGSAIVTYPVSAGNYMGMLAGVLSVAGGIAGTVLSGGALAPALIGGAVGASHLHTDVSHSGGFSGCAGAMGSKKPYLIVSRPQIAMADNYQHYTGIPANSKVTLGNCDGYAKVKSVYVNSITRATEEEKAMIEAQLKAGVLV